MLLFRSEEHVVRWCRLWRRLPGAVLSLEQTLGLAREWYADRLNPDWRPKTAEEAKAAFASLGLKSSFWRMAQ
jgi:hypothetical protein